MASDDRLGVAPVEAPRTFVIDFSSPNVAKPMHVGHLRSTIIGDALARLLRFLGHKVITDNHLGDWGTQFGILLYGYKHFLDEKAFETDPVGELARLYVHVRKQIKKIVNAQDEEEEAPDDPIARAAREETAKLHAGDPENLRLWQKFMPHCYEEIDRIYRRLDVHFDHTLGESFYHPMLADVVGDLRERGIAQESEGAIAVFFGDKDSPALIQKRDGAYTYTTTDLATIRYRMEQWHPDAILYVVDFRQGLHFKHLFDIARRWGYDSVELQHISFGSVLGEDGRPIRTREGTVRSFGLVARTKRSPPPQAYTNRISKTTNRGMQTPRNGAPFTKWSASAPSSTPTCRRIEPAIIGSASRKCWRWTAIRRPTCSMPTPAIGASSARATSMCYPCAGIRRRDPLQRSEERALALQLLRFQDALTAAAAEYKPNLITAYLWDLAKTYSGFFQNCPVLKAETAELRQSRLLLCDLTARVIQRGLDLLGIRTVERM